MNPIPTISIIIPVHNAESTISRTLDSLTGNTFDIEIVCVNDGSEDGTGAIINQKIENDNRIWQIVQENGGAAKARNVGISRCRGKYIMFCDADDEYDSHVLDCILEDINEIEPDYIVFDRRTIYENGNEFSWLKSKEKTLYESFDWINYFNHTINDHNHSYVVFNKVFKAQIVHEYRVTFSEELLLCEDLFFNFAFLQHANNMVEDGRAVYLQHKVPSSFTAAKRKDYYWQDIKVLEIIARDYCGEIKQCEMFKNRHILESAIHAIERALLGRDAETMQEKREIINAILDDSRFKDAYDEFINNTDYYTGRKLQLLHYRLITMYYLRYIFIPQIKGKLFKHG